MPPPVPLPTIVIAGTHSGVGKTTFATGIMAALRRRGLRVQGFKVGPDFIDPTFHLAATGRPSYNLDGWMLSRDANLQIFARAAYHADVAVIEGVMGLFDGKDGVSLTGTTAEMALWLDAAVLLVVDAAAMAGSAAAVVHGFDTLFPELRVAAVAANRAAGAGHYAYFQHTIAGRCRPVPIGYLPNDSALTLPERHLGLQLAAESLTAEHLQRLAECVEQHLDLDRLLELSARTRPSAPPPSIPCAPRLVRPRIGIARDAAFCFYYQDNLDLLQSLGAELVEFSPVADSSLPAGVDGLYFGGGYPELHAAALSANAGMRSAVAAFIAQDAPVYAECGGFMYLCEAIVDSAGQDWPMAGIFPTRVRMQQHIAKLGYVELEAASDAGWLAPGQSARGQEFRYSETDPMPAYVNRLYGGVAEGYRVHRTSASYVHLHFLSCPAFAERFVTECAKWRELRRL